MKAWMMVLVVCVAWMAGSVRGEGARPNVLILLTDDQGYGDMSCHGNPYLKTPNMDRLHGESVRFTDFHVAPMCTPTRGQLMSGMDALRNGATSVTYGRALLRRGIPTMAEAFGAAGYKTGLFGKWHLGDMYPYRPMDRGFGEAVYHLGFGLNSAPEFDNDYFDTRYLHNGRPERFRGYCTDNWFDQAMAWMKERKQANEPFFVYLPTNVPHGPAWVDPKYSQPFQNQKPKLPAAFFGMIANLDENLGRLEKFLSESGLRENTIVILMTDNGGTAGVPVYNAGMRGHKTEYYEGGHRVPCFVRWPAGGLRGPGDVATPTQIQDLFPTLMELCQIKAPAGATFDGVSLAGLLRDAKATLAERMLVVQYGQDLKKDDACVIWNQWRLVHGKELYDVKADPGQKTDVAAQHGDVVEKMKRHYDGWWAKVEPGLKEYAPITIGAAQQNPVTLVSSDWQDVYCDNSPTVRAGGGGPRGGPWNVVVDQDGEYEIALRRWPVQVDVPMSSGLPEQKTRVGVYPVGVGFPIAKAKLNVAGQELKQAVAPDARAAVFSVKLTAGTRTQLHGWFADKEGKDLCGAYYADVRRK